MAMFFLRTIHHIKVCRAVFSIIPKNLSRHNQYHMDHIVWMDLEMTGLNVEKHKIMEISCLITNKDLKIVAEAPTQCVYQTENDLSVMDVWCKKYLQKNGLIDACRKSSIHIEQAEETILQFLKQNVPENSCPLAGNSVYMDRLFIVKYLPTINEYLHYRIIDVSSIKELCKRWNPKIYSAAPSKKLTHRSLDDIKESIDELKYYRENFFLI